MLTQLHSVREVRSSLGYAMEIFKQKKGCIFLEHLSMVTDYVSEEFELHRGHEVLA